MYTYTIYIVYVIAKKYNDLCAKMMKEADITAKALDKAISSSVRLCVVAPTVNVHISDKKMKFQSKTSEIELRQFLEEKVLSKFVFLYNQEHDDIAPDGKLLTSIGLSNGEQCADFVIILFNFR